MKQTAVEWLVSVFAHNDILDHKVLSSDARLYNLYLRLVEQAKEMEKQQIISSFNEGMINGVDYFAKSSLDEAEQYYSENFSKESW